MQTPCEFHYPPVSLWAPERRACPLCPRMERERQTATEVLEERDRNHADDSFLKMPCGWCDTMWQWCGCWIIFSTSWTDKRCQRVLFAWQVRPDSCVYSVQWLCLPSSKAQHATRREIVKFVKLWIRSEDMDRCFAKCHIFCFGWGCKAKSYLAATLKSFCIGSWIVAMLWECHASVIPSVIPSVMPCLRTWNLLMLLLSGAYRLNARAPDSPPRSPEWRVATWMACHVATIRAMPCRACVCS